MMNRQKIHAKRINTDFYCFSSQATNAALVIMYRFKPLSYPRQRLLQMMNLTPGQSDKNRLWRFPNRLIHKQINYMSFIEMIDFS